MVEEARQARGVSEADLRAEVARLQELVQHLYSRIKELQPVPEESQVSHLPPL